MDPATVIDLSHPLLESMPCYPGDPVFEIKSACCIPLIPAKSSPKSVPVPDAIGILTVDQPPCPQMVVRVHALSLGTHTGTHIDAPFHFFPSGQKLHEIPPSQFVGRAVVLDIRRLARERAMISWADVTNSRTGTGTGTGIASALSRIGPRTEDKADIVLFWTGWDIHWGTPNYFSHPYFSRDVAIALHDLGTRIVGVDVLSPDETPADENVETVHGWGMHEVLLGHGVLICENLKGLGELDAAGVQGRGQSETWVSLMPLSVHGADGAPVRAYGWKSVKCD